MILQLYMLAGKVTSLHHFVTTTVIYLAALERIMLSVSVDRYIGNERRKVQYVC